MLRMTMTFLATLMIATTAFAASVDRDRSSSRGYGNPGASKSPSYSNSGSDRFRPSSDDSDLMFEKGKAIYGREESDHGKFEYCVISSSAEGKPVKISGKALEGYKGGSYDQLGENIRNCDHPEESLAKSFNKYESIAVLYYLSKRYKLKLKRT